MVAEASCYFVARKESYDYIAFVRYGDVVRVLLQGMKCCIVLRMADLLRDEELWEYYLVSVLLTPEENRRALENEYPGTWYIRAQWDHKRMHFREQTACTTGFNRDWLKDGGVGSKPRKMSNGRRVKRFWKNFRAMTRKNRSVNDLFYPYIPEGVGLFEEYLYKTIEVAIEYIEFDMEMTQCDINEFVAKHVGVAKKWDMPLEVTNMIMRYGMQRPLYLQ